MKRLLTSSDDIESYIVRKEEFATRTRNFRAYWYGETYKVFSYSTTIAEFYDGIWYVNDTRYSTTTTKHQAVVRRALWPYWVDDSVHAQNVPVSTWLLRIHCMLNLGKVAQERIQRISVH
jgi:hypothetical protein